MAARQPRPQRLHLWAEPVTCRAKRLHDGRRNDSEEKMLRRSVQPVCTSVTPRRDDLKEQTQSKCSTHVLLSWMIYSPWNETNHPTTTGVNEGFSSEPTARLICYGFAWDYLQDAAPVYTHAEDATVVCQCQCSVCSSKCFQSKQWQFSENAGS